ncbi:hypothetical protein ABPG74_008629 [Tetrahymena malaccensis]
MIQQPNQAESQEKKIELQRIFKQLEEKKNLKVISEELEPGFYGQFVIAKDIDKDCLRTVKIISIFDRNILATKKKLVEAKREADFLKKSKHPNIIKYIDEFQIDSNYFIIMEKCQNTLEYLIQQSKKHQIPIQKYQFCDFACQVLSALHFIHQKDGIIKHLTIQNILIDNLNQIKLCDFELSPQESFSDKLSEFFICHRHKPNKVYNLQNVPLPYQNQNISQDILQIPAENIIYYPPEYINNLNISLQKKQGKFCQDNQKDIWSFGISFYLLGGATLQDCLKLKNGEYVNIPELDQSLNKILSQILSLNSDLRPKISNLIDEFKIKKKQFSTIDQAELSYKQFEQLKKSKQFWLSYQYITVCCLIQPKNIQYWYKMAKIQCGLNLQEIAQKSLNKCLNLDKKHQKSLSLLGCLHFQKLETEIILNIIVGEDCPLLDDLAIKQGISLLQKSIKIKPNYKDYISVGVAHMLSGKMQEAINSCQMGLKFNLNEIQISNIYLFLGMCYYNFGKIEQSVDQIKKCIDQDPNNYYGYIILSKIFQMKGELDEALTLAQKAKNTDPKFLYTNILLLLIYIDKKCYNDAIQIFKELTELNLRVQQKHIALLSFCYIEQDMIDEALEFAQKAIKNNPNHYNNYFALALEIDPKSDKFYYILGNAYKELNQTDLAIQMLQKSLELKRNDIVFYCLAKILTPDYDKPIKLTEVRNNFDKSIELIKEGIQLGQDNIQGYKLLYVFYGQKLYFKSSCMTGYILLS